MTDETAPENLLEPKTNRSPAEVGREVFRMVQRHGAIRVTSGESEFDVEIYISEE